MPSTGQLSTPCTVKPFLYFSLSFFHSSRVCSGWVKFNGELERNKLILWELIGREATVVDGPWLAGLEQGGPGQYQSWARSVFLEWDIFFWVVFLYSERAIDWQREPFYSGSQFLVFQSRVRVLLGLSGHKSVPSSAEKLVSVTSYLWFSHWRKILHSLSIKGMVMLGESREQFCFTWIMRSQNQKEGVHGSIDRGPTSVSEQLGSVKECTWQNSKPDTTS